MNTHHITRASKKTHVLVVVAFSICLAVLCISLLRAPKDGRLALEARFADTSKGGLSIVPASCPSDPHKTGECGDVSQTLACDGNSLNLTVPGTYIITIPAAYAEIEVAAWGAGGGGGAAGYYYAPYGYAVAAGAGQSGASSIFGTLVAGGGMGGGSATCAWGGGCTTAIGAGGVASGGDTNTHGNPLTSSQTSNSTAGGSAPNGGVGGAVTAGYYGNAGSAPGGGGSGAGGTQYYWPYGFGAGGGSGSYVKKSYARGSLAYSSEVTVVVGAGGAGGVNTTYGVNGGAGGAGKVAIRCVPIFPMLCDSTIYNFNKSGDFFIEVPNAYQEIRVSAWGGGGGGAAAGYYSSPYAYPGSAGGGGAASTFGALVAGGGSGGGSAACAWGGGCTTAIGAGGTASGGDTNTHGNPLASSQTSNSTAGGNAPNGGVGGPAATTYAGGPGVVPGGGGGGAGGTQYYWPYGFGAGGGSGGYVQRTYAEGSLTSGDLMRAHVGFGGPAGTSTYGYAGGTGATGQISIQCIPKTQLICDGSTVEFTSTTTPSYFQVPPSYGAIVVKAWGGGGGGGGAPYYSDDGYGNVTLTYAGHTGSAGVASSFGSLIANGGAGGAISTCPWAYGSGVCSVALATGGTASGGDINTQGNQATASTSKYSTPGGSAPNGGSGGVAATVYSGSAGSTPGAGGGGGGGTIYHPHGFAAGGGSGGYVEKTYTTGALTPGSTMTVQAGAGGVGGNDYYNNLYYPTTYSAGGKGADGKVTVQCLPNEVIQCDVGTTTITTAGTHIIQIPDTYASIDVKLWGAGGGGGGAGVTFPAGTGGSGGATTFDVLSAGGGSGGNASICGYWPTYMCRARMGLGGTASGGSVNTNGNPTSISTSSAASAGGSAPFGGAGGAAAATTSGYYGVQAGGGGGGAYFNAGGFGAGGGSGAYVQKTYASTTLTGSSRMTLVIGSGGAGGLGYGATSGGNKSGDGTGSTNTYGGGAGAAGKAEFMCTALSSCSVTFSKNPIQRGQSATVSWSSSRATTFSLNTIGLVTPNATGSAIVSPSVSTSYGGVLDGDLTKCPATLTVLDPTASLLVDGVSTTTVNVGDTVSYEWSSTRAVAMTSWYTVDQNACGDTAGAQIPWIANSANGSANAVISACQAGRQYTTYFRITNSAGYQVSSQISVTVRPLPACTISVNPTSITQGNNATLTWSSTNATVGSISTVGSVPLSGSTAVSPSASTTYTGTFTGDGGIAQCAASLAVSCGVAGYYSCSGQDIIYTDPSCNTSIYQSCLAPMLCSNGVNTCVPPVIVVDPPNATSSGHLIAQPRLLRKGFRTMLYWGISGAQSCTVSGNGDSWTTLTSGQYGVQSSPVNATTIYTLNCTPFAGGVPFSESVTVGPAPTYNER